jgi:hypothetical protein
VVVGQEHFPLVDVQFGHSFQLQGWPAALTGPLLAPDRALLGKARENA